jgi:multiple sugar transport system substrate-binding protein
MTRKWFPALVLATLLLACRSRKPVPPTTGPLLPDRPTPRIVLRFATYEWEHKRYQDLIRDFETSNPGVAIQLVSIDELLGLSNADRGWPDDALLRLASAADVIKMQAWDAEIEPGLLQDLAPLIDADPTFNVEDIYPETLVGCQEREHIYCLPSIVDGYLLFYDKDAFDQVGVPYPEPGWTWGDLASLAVALTDRQREKVNRWGTLLRSSEVLPFVESRAGPLLDIDNDPPIIRFNQPEVIQAVCWLVDLVSEHKAARYLEDEQAALGDNLIAKKKVAIWPYGYGAWSFFSEQRNVGIVPFPADSVLQGEGAETTPISAYDRIAISAGSAYPNLAWRWLKAFSEAAGYGQLVPARRSVADSSGFWERADPELANALRYAIEHSHGTQWSPSAYPALRRAPGYSAFYDAIEAILNGEKSVEAALSEAQVRAEAAVQVELNRRAKASPVPTVVIAPGEDEQNQPDAVTIVFASAAFQPIRPDALHPYRDLAKTFQQAYPNIIVEVKLPASPHTTIQNLSQEADCFSWTADLQEEGNLEVILNLEPFLDADPAFSIADFYPSLLEPFVSHGELWGLPSQAKPELFKYNKDLFDAAGLDYPSVNWTIDDFQSMAIALTQGEGEEKQYGFAGSPSESTLIRLLERRGADLVDTTIDPPTMALNAPSTIEAMRWYVDLSAVYGVKPVFVTDLTNMSALIPAAYAEWAALVGSGQAGIWPVLESLELVHDPEGMNVGLITMPARPGSAAGAYQTVYGYFISANTEAKEPCWQWITYLTAQPEAVWGVPARRSVVESDAYRQLVGVERAAVYQASVSGANRAPSFQFGDDQAWLAPGMFWLIQAYGQVVEGENTVEASLDAAQGNFDAYRACIFGAGGASDDDAWQACLRKVDPILAEIVPGD